MAFSVGELVGYLTIKGGAEADRQVRSVQRGLDLTSRSAEKFGASLKTSEAQLARAGRTADSVSARSGKLRAAQLSVVAAQERYNAVLNAGNASTARLASSEAALIRAQQRLAAIRPAPIVRPETPGLLERSRHGLVGMVETVGKLGLSLGAFELGMKAIEEFKEGNQLTTSLNAVQAASQATDAEMLKVRATAVAMGKDFTIPGATAVDAADAINDLVKSGVALDRALVAARPALLLAAAAQVNIADAARVTGDVLDDFHLKADQAGHVANVLAAASNSAGGGLMDLFDGMKYAGPTARTLGIDVATTAAALVELAKSGMQGSLGGTAFSNMLARLNPTAKSAKMALHDLGVNAFDAHGKFVGLPVVFDQLHAAMERMNPQQFAQAVQIAFGARAKNAVFNFAHGGAAAFDEFYRKMQAGDVQDYADKMNRGLSAAGKQLRKEVVSWAIDINGKVQPALASAVFALGDSLPHAIATAQRTLKPLEDEFGAVLVPTLRLTAGVLGLVSTGLTDVGTLLSHHAGTVQVLGTVVVGMWAAWKGYTIATVAVRAVGSALDTVRLKAMYARDSVSGIAAGTTSISAGTLALGALGLALGVAAYAWQKHAASVAASKQEVEGFTSAIQQDSGALGENTKAAVINALQKAKAFDAARKFGISLADLTDASLGNAGALAKVNGVLDDWKRAMDESGASSDNVMGDVDGSADAYWKLHDAVNGTNSKIKEAAQNYKDSQEAQGKSVKVTEARTAAEQALAAALTYTVDADGKIVQGQQKVGSAVDDTTEALVKQKTAAQLLKDSWDALDGTAVTAEQAQNAFLDSLDALSESVKNNGHSLDQNSSAGRKNREQLVSIIEAAKEQAQATADVVAATDGQTAGLLAGNAQLKANEDRIRKQASALHLSKGETDALIKALGQLSEVRPVAKPDVEVSPAQAKAAALKARLDALGKQQTAVVKVNDGAATPRLAAIQADLDRLNGKVSTSYVNIVASVSGIAAANHVRERAGFATGTGSGGAPDGEFTVGEQGWELVRKYGNRVEIFSHADSKRMLPEGPSVPAFVSGTHKAPAKPKPVVGTIVETAGGGAAYGIANYIKGSIPSVRQAAHELSVAVNDAFKLRGVQAEIAHAKASLTNLVQARSQFAGGVVDAQRNQVDVTKYGDAESMLSALRGGSANNANFIAEEKRLQALHVPSALIQALTKDGANPGLDTVAHANSADLRQIIAEYSRFTGSAQAAGSLAGNVAFGPQIAAQQHAIAAGERQQAQLLHAIDKIVAGLGRETKQPVTIKLDGEKIATVVIKSKAFAGEIDEITHAITY